MEIERLQAKNREADRLLAVARNQETVLRESAKRGELAARDLRAQTSKYKADLEKVRGQFVSENRRRDLEVQKLKRHIDDFQRGRKDGLVRSGGDCDQLERNQNNSFLADKLGSVCRENDAVRALIRDTMKELRKMTDVKSTKTKSLQDVPADVGASTFTLGSYDAMTKDVSSVLEQCRSVLEDPSFVSVESVEEAFREQETYIRDLRSGWEKMAGRLRQTQQMMVSWRERMMDGDSIDLNDLGLGLDLGKSIAAPIFEDTFFTSSTSHHETDPERLEEDRAYLNNLQPQRHGLETVEEDTEEVRGSPQDSPGEDDDWLGAKEVIENAANENESYASVEDIQINSSEGTTERRKRKSGDVEDQSARDVHAVKRQEQCPDRYIALSPAKRGVALPKHLNTESPHKTRPPSKISHNTKPHVSSQGSPKLFSSPAKESYHPTFSLDTQDAILLSLEQDSQSKRQSSKQVRSIFVLPISLNADGTEPLFHGISPLKTAHNLNAPRPTPTISEKLAAAEEEANEAADILDHKNKPGEMRTVDGAAVAHKRRPTPGHGRAKGRRKRKSTLTRDELDSLLLD